MLLAPWHLRSIRFFPITPLLQTTWSSWSSIHSLSPRWSSKRMTPFLSSKRTTRKSLLSPSANSNDVLFVVLILSRTSIIVPLVIWTLNVRMRDDSNNMNRTAENQRKLNLYVNIVVCSSHLDGPLSGYDLWSAYATHQVLAAWYWDHSSLFCDDKERIV